MDGSSTSRWRRHGRLGGLGVLNLEGVQTRYENPDEVLAEVVPDKEKATTLMKSSIKSQSARI